MIINWLLGMAIVVAIGALVTMVVSQIIMFKRSMDINEELTTHSPAFRGAHRVFGIMGDTFVISAILVLIFAVYRAHCK
jgi:hypothetical protein